MYYTPDNLKEIKAEEKAYSQWERDEKNRILSIVNIDRKQREWNKLFSPMRQLSSNEVY